MTTVTETKIVKAKYAEAILLYLRLRESEEGPTEIYYKVLAHKAMTMIGLTHEEMSELTPRNEVPSKEHNVYLTYQVLKHMGLIKNPRRGYWELTRKGRQSRCLHKEYIDGLDALNKKNSSKRRDKKAYAK